MPTNAKLIRRSVGTQSNLEVTESENTSGRDRGLLEIGSKFSNLCKKSAYRNLLQRSITVDAQGRVNIALDFITNGRSRATQTSSGNDRQEMDEPVRTMSVLKEECLDVGIPMQVTTPDISLTPSLLSEEILPQVHKEEIPGTSKLISPANLFESPSLQFEDRETSVEGSLAVIDSYNDKLSYASRTSNAVYVCEEGLRRQSDEAVLLVQDYQSYDILNTARRQETNPASNENLRNSKPKKKKRGGRGASSRPVPIPPNESDTVVLVCRICHEGEEVEPLIRPCLCKGSVGSIHAKCLKMWLEQSNTSRCEICRYPYAIRQKRRYTKCASITVFLRSVADRRALMYDIVSFVGVTPLCIVGIAMCIRASLVTAPSDPGASFQMGNVTRAGMIMLSSTIIIAYGVWLYTLLSYHYKSWKRWYNSCFDVEVIPVSITSEERLEALQRMGDERRRRVSRLEHGGSVVGIIQSSSSYICLDQRLMAQICTGLELLGSSGSTTMPSPSLDQVKDKSVGISVGIPFIGLQKNWMRNDGKRRRGTSLEVILLYAARNIDLIPQTP